MGNGKGKDKVKKSDLLKDAIQDLDTQISERLDESERSLERTLEERDLEVDNEIDQLKDRLDRMSEELRKLMAAHRVETRVHGELVAIRHKIQGWEAAISQNALDICVVGDRLQAHLQALAEQKHLEDQEKEWEKYYNADSYVPEDLEAAKAMLDAFQRKYPHLVERLRALPTQPKPVDAELDALLEEKQELSWLEHRDLADRVHDALGLVGIEIPIQMLRATLDSNLNEAFTWAMQQHLIASDNEIEGPVAKPGWLNELEHELAARRDKAIAMGHPSAAVPPRVPMALYAVDNVSEEG